MPSSLVLFREKVLALLEHSSLVVGCFCILFGGVILARGIVSRGLGAIGISVLAVLPIVFGFKFTPWISQIFRHL